MAWLKYSQSRGSQWTTGIYLRYHLAYTLPISQERVRADPRFLRLLVPYAEPPITAPPEHVEAAIGRSLGPSSTPATNGVGRINLGLSRRRARLPRVCLSLYIIKFSQLSFITL